MNLHAGPWTLLFLALAALCAFGGDPVMTSVYGGIAVVDSERLRR